MTRIGLVVHGQPPELVGGTERLVADLAADLAVAGHAVEVFSGSIEWRERQAVVRDESGAVPVVRIHRSDLFFERWDKLHNPFVERAYGDWLDAWRPELVHVHHWARLTTTLVQVAHDRGVPAVASLHDLFPSCPRYHRVKADDSFCEDAPGLEVCRGCAPRWSFQGDAEIDASLTAYLDDMRREIELAAALVAPTEGHGRRIMGWLGAEREVTTIPPAGSGVPAPAARPLGDRVAAAGDPLRVGVFGHLHPLKGVAVLLDAQAASEEPARLQVHVWGEAPDEPTEAALRARAGDRDVVWHGAYTPDTLADAPIDVVVLPTLCVESYAFTLDEAAALGVPIVASDTGALAERATGRVVLFGRGDARALAARLDALAVDPAARAALRDAAAPAVLSAAQHREALLAVYERVLAAGPPSCRPGDARALRRREHAFLLREAGLAELLRSEGWEQVVAGLQARVADLEARAGRPGGAAPRP